MKDIIGMGSSSVDVDWIATRRTLFAYRKGEQTKQMVTTFWFKYTRFEKQSKSRKDFTCKCIKLDSILNILKYRQL